MRRPFVLFLGLVIAIAIGVIALAFERDLRIARERVAAGSLVVETRCGPIEYSSEGAGPVVLSVHGAGGGFDQGRAIVAPLVARGFRVIAVSRFGYLRTPLPADASAEAQADAHACLLDALGIDRAALIGASAGAPSTLQFALRHPERARAIVLLVPAVFVPRPGGAQPVTASRTTRVLFETALRFDFVLWVAIRIAPQAMIRGLLATPLDVVRQASLDEQARVQAMIEAILPVSVRRLGLLNDALITSTQPRYPLERIRVPTLAVSAADDLFGTLDAARYTAEQIPGARLVAYPNGGHALVGRQREVMNEIAGFVR